MRLIDADALVVNIALYMTENAYINDTALDVLKMVAKWTNEAPTIEAEPVRHGYWDASGKYIFPDGSLAVRCSECGCDLEEHEYKEYWWHYCPVCGAKMDL